jgi:hypothetical protein
VKSLSHFDNNAIFMYGLDDRGLIPWTEENFFLSSTASRSALPIQSHIQWVWGFPGGGKAVGREAELISI